MKFDYVFFDSGGTIYGNPQGGKPSPGDFESFGLERVESLLKTYGYPSEITNERDAFNAANAKCVERYGVMKYTFKDVLEVFFNSLNVEIGDEITACLSDAYAGPRMSHWLFPGTREVMQKLDEQGVVLGVIANTIWSSYHMDRAFDGVGLLPHLKYRVYSGNIKLAKPEKAIFEYAAQLANTHGKRVLYVGNDIEKDVKPSKAFGWSAAFRVSQKVPDSGALSDLDFDDIFDLYDYITGD